MEGNKLTRRFISYLRLWLPKWSKWLIFVDFCWKFLLENRRKNSVLLEIQVILKQNMYNLLRCKAFLSFYLQLVLVLNGSWFENC